VNHSRRRFLIFSVVAAASFLNRASNGAADDRKRQPRFLPEERRIIEEYYYRGKSQKGKSKGLPPGLAKRGSLPPGLQKQLDKNGQLPPGLQKRLSPLPVDLNRRLPRLPDYWDRVILDRHVVLMDRRTNRILDIIEDVIDLATGR
jgi:hypothetical protein